MNKRVLLAFVFALCACIAAAQRSAVTFNGAYSTSRNYYPNDVVYTGSASSPTYYVALQASTNVAVTNILYWQPWSSSSSAGATTPATSTLLKGNGSVNGVIAAGAGDVASLIATQTGCTTAGNVWVPASNTCVPAASGSFAAGTDLSGSSTSQNVIGFNGTPIDTTQTPTLGQAWVYDNSTARDRKSVV